MDFAQYFTVSEQQPSLVALGVLVSGETVLKAGGLLIQPLPGCPDEIIDASASTQMENIKEILKNTGI